MRGLMVCMPPIIRAPPNRQLGTHVHSEESIPNWARLCYLSHRRIIKQGHESHERPTHIDGVTCRKVS